jgi:hypothetical protein
LRVHEVQEKKTSLNRILKELSGRERISGVRTKCRKREGAKKRVNERLSERGRERKREEERGGERERERERELEGATNGKHL